MTSDKSNDSEDQDSTSRNNDINKFNPRKFRMESREKAVASLSAERNESITLDLLLKQCHALVVTNQEIWERCKPFHRTIDSGESQHCRCMFYRAGYSNIRANTLPYQNNTVGFESTAEVTKKSFELPMSLPERLAHLVVFPLPEKNDIMPNYELFLERSMLLIDDVLIGFLQEFKKFLEHQQIALGKVDDWLVQADENAAFLQEQFNMTLSHHRANLQQMVGRYSSLETCQHLLGSSECLRCRVAFRHHRLDQQNGGGFCANDEQSGCFPMGERELFPGRYDCPGNINLTFCIDTPSERSRFVKFLEFLRHNDEGANA